MTTQPFEGDETEEAIATVNSVLYGQSREESDELQGARDHMRIE